MKKQLLKTKNAAKKGVASTFNLQPSNCPKHVAILGLGPSVADYMSIARGMGGRQAYCDEVWSINALGNVFDCDRIFHMDDVRIQEIRAAARPDSNIANMLKWMKTSRVPIYTSRLHPDYPALVEFPLEEVINDLTFDYFNNTAAWTLAFAIYLGVEKVSMFGCDYTYPNAHDAEKGRACLEFWLGFAAAKGIRIGMSKSTTLMDAIYSRQERLYGYDTRTVEIEQIKTGYSVTFTEVETLPTADEIEARYDHSKHPNALVSGDKS